jgi:hypothetical protein
MIEGKIKVYFYLLVFKKQKPVVGFRCKYYLWGSLFYSAVWPTPWPTPKRWGGFTEKSLGTVYIFYCKRAILFLSSSKILTPHPPLRPASVYAFVAGGGQTRRAERGMGGQYFGRREK